MTRYGWLVCRKKASGARARKDYRLTAAGRKVLKLIREQLEELHEEVVSLAEGKK